MADDIKKIGDRLIRDEISEALLNQIKALPSKQRKTLNLYIESKLDCGIGRIEKKIDTLITMQENQSAEIAKIKRVVGCNGD